MHKLRNNRSNIYKYWTFVNAGLFFLAGIAAGFVFQTQRTVGFYSMHVEEVFNWALMLFIWFAGVVSTLSFYAVYVHLNHQEQQIELLTYMAGNQPHPNMTKITDLHAEPEPVVQKPAEPAVQAAPAPQEETGGWSCPRCGHLNAPDAMYCTVCGQSK